MSILKAIEWRFKTTVMSARAIGRWGTCWPKQVTPHEGASPICIDPRDKRARKKLIYDTLRNRLPRNRRFWRLSVETLAPDVALDVGVNWGECLFTPRYPSSTIVHGFEANPHLQPYLEQSLQLHPDRERINLHFGIVSEEHGGDSEFFVDTRWSGSSAAVKDDAAAPDRYHAVKTLQLSVDGVLSEAGALPKSLLFKIDVEGYESRVLDGMAKTLAAVDWAVGFVEIDAESAQAAGVDLAEYWQRLQSDFHVYAFGRDERAVDMTGQSLAALDDLTQKKRIVPKHSPIHTDLILLAGKPTRLVQKFVRTWL